MTEKRGRGRPVFKPTALHRRRVEQYVCSGMSHDAIAKVMGISDETLRKYFEVELSTGAQKRRAEVIDLLFAAARKGNVTAQKKLEEMSGKIVAEGEFTAPQKAADAVVAAPAKPQKLGKKEEAAASAHAMLSDAEWGADLAVSMGIDSKRPQ